MREEMSNYFCVSPAGEGLTGGCVKVAIGFIMVTSWKSFIHLRHCVTPPPTEDKEEKMKSYIQISTTTETKEQAQTIAQHLVEAKLAACVQITGPTTSIYRWKGKVENAQEWLCLIKTRDDLFKKVEAAIKKMHPYETPEIIAVPIVKGSKEYLNWLDDETVNKIKL